MSIAATLPETGFLRLRDIIGDRKADPPRPGLIPIGASSWWEGVKEGRYPAPTKLGPRTTAWRVEDIRALIERLGREAESAAKHAEASEIARRYEERHRAKAVAQAEKADEAVAARRHCEREGTAS